MVAKVGLSTVQGIFLVVAVAVTGALPATANTAPLATADSTATHARAGVLVDVLANDQDLDGDLLAVSITSPPLRGTAVVQEDGTILYAPDPVTFESSGGDSFTYQVSDGQGGTASATVTVSELPVPVELQPVPAPTVLYAEDFSGSWPDPNWVVTDFGTTDGSSNWTISNGELAQFSNIWNDPWEKGTYAVFTGGASWTNYRLRLNIRSTDDDRIGVLFRYRDSGNHYRFDWRREVSHRELVKLQGDTRITLAEDFVPYQGFDDYWIEIRVEGSLIEVFVDAELVFSVVDTSFSSGSIGVNSHGNSSSYFDNIEVVALPLEEERILFEDDFTDGDLLGWTIADVGRNSGPSNWHVAEGELREDSNIYGGFIWGLAGGSAIVDNGGSWTDYRLQAKMRASDDDVIVFYIRFQDFQNNYSFHWARQGGSKRIRKMAAGVWTDLAVEGGGYATGRDYVVEFSAVGTLLEVRIDGEQIFSVDDTSPDAFLSGTAGLGTEAMFGVVFDNVRVTAIPPQEVTP